MFAQVTTYRGWTLPAVAQSQTTCSQLARAGCFNKAIREKTFNARVLVVGYPHLLPATFPEQSCISLAMFTGEFDFIRGLANRLNQTIAAAASESGVEFEDVRDDFAGHEPCGSKG